MRNLSSELCSIISVDVVIIRLGIINIHPNLGVLMRMVGQPLPEMSNMATNNASCLGQKVVNKAYPETKCNAICSSKQLKKQPLTVIKTFLGTSSTTGMTIT